MAGRLSPGQPVREEALAEICGVSRTPVREAMRRLEAEQLIRRTDSHRSFVAQWSLDDIEEGFKLRAMLESHAAERAAHRISSYAIDELEQQNLLIASAINQEVPDTAGFASLNRKFHSIITAAAQSEQLIRLLAGIVQQPIVLRTAGLYDREQLERSVVEHRELIAAFRKRDGAWAASIMSAHIRRAFHTYSDAFQDYLKHAQAVEQG